MPIILDGKKARQALKIPLIERVEKFSLKGLVPCIAIIQVGNRPDSNAYVTSKKKFAAEIGAIERHILFPETVALEEVSQTIEKLNSDSSVHGIIVQLPLPADLDKEKILNLISPEKDVDGLSNINVKKWTTGETDAIWPATTRGIKELLNFYNITLAGKKVAVIGRSTLVGRPTAAMCSAAGAEVVVCHRQTVDLAGATKKADIIIAAAGAPRLIGAAHVRPGQVIVDVGLSVEIDPKNGARKLVGDVDFDAVSSILDAAGAITPVPGGVGQMTVLGLFENLIDATESQA